VALLRPLLKKLEPPRRYLLIRLQGSVDSFSHIRKLDSSNVSYCSRVDGLPLQLIEPCGMLGHSSWTFA